MKQKSPKFDLYSHVTETIIKVMESGSLEWVKSWTSTTELPHNALTGHKYKGCNIPILWLTARMNGYRFDRWMTFKQMCKAGGRLKPGQTSTKVVYWRFVNHKTKKDSDGKPVKYPLLRYWSMFNIDQMTGLDEKFYEKPESSKLSESEKIQHADKFFENISIKVEHGGSKACYIPSQDVIRLPEFSDFKTAADYYSVRAHETAHATGHASRLNRDLSGRFGDDSYAMEELVAELTSAFVCASLGLKPISRDGMKDHASYLQHWIKVLKKDPKAFVKAGTLASNAHQYILSLQPAVFVDEEEHKKAAA